MSSRRRLESSVALALLLPHVAGCAEPPAISVSGASATATATATASGRATCDERIKREYQITGGPFDDKCSQDGDCVAAWGNTDCGAGCALALSKSGKVAHDEAIAEANRGPCKDFKKDGCARPQPTCIVRDPVCKDGRCITPGH